MLNPWATIFWFLPRPLVIIVIPRGREGGRFCPGTGVPPGDFVPCDPPGYPIGILAKLRL